MTKKQKAEYDMTPLEVARFHYENDPQVALQAQLRQVFNSVDLEDNLKAQNREYVMLKLTNALTKLKYDSIED